MFCRFRVEGKEEEKGGGRGKGKGGKKWGKKLAGGLRPTRETGPGLFFRLRCLQ